MTDYNSQPPVYEPQDVVSSMSLIDPGYQQNNEAFLLQPVIQVTRESAMESLDQSFNIGNNLRLALTSLPNEINVEALAFDNNPAPQVERMAASIYPEILRQLSERAIEPDFGLTVGHTMNQELGEDVMLPRDYPTPFP